MCVHLSGAKSSPSWAAFALNRAILDKGKSYDVNVVKEAKQCFYVDDCLVSTRTIDEARTYAGQLKSKLEDGGFNLSKWANNDLRNHTEYNDSLLDLTKDFGIPVDEDL
ncbi:hypothetical protein X801_05134 [Opisthorchis viverrini]|uniref:Reverse transcriptase domain-containing protein n=1 Tax=Opisthorchis viverrini TaxID=6198 RepID=A0A1S8WX24_OPIVI|nr:hypothetical protein X801_05134 [Opisthorchis viverrini]